MDGRECLKGRVARLSLKSKFGRGGIGEYLIPAPGGGVPGSSRDSSRGGSAGGGNSISNIQYPIFNFQGNRHRRLAAMDGVNA